jgi:hypothetical protein
MVSGNKMQTLLYLPEESTFHNILISLSDIIVNPQNKKKRTHL